MGFSGKVSSIARLLGCSKFFSVLSLFLSVSLTTEKRISLFRVLYFGFWSWQWNCPIYFRYRKNKLRGFLNSSHETVKIRTDIGIAAACADSRTFVFTVSMFVYLFCNLRRAKDSPLQTETSKSLTLTICVCLIHFSMIVYLYYSFRRYIRYISLIFINRNKQSFYISRQNLVLFLIFKIFWHFLVHMSAVPITRGSITSTSFDSCVWLFLIKWNTHVNNCYKTLTYEIPSVVCLLSTILFLQTILSSLCDRCKNSLCDGCISHCVPHS